MKIFTNNSMNIFTTTIAATTIALAISTTSEAEINPYIDVEVRAAAGINSQVKTVVEGETVVLYGYVKNTYALNQIERTAKANGAKRVINSVQVR